MTRPTDGVLRAAKRAYAAIIDAADDRKRGTPLVPGLKFHPICVVCPGVSEFQVRRALRVLVESGIVHHKHMRWIAVLGPTGDTQQLPVEIMCVEDLTRLARIGLRVEAQAREDRRAAQVSEARERKRIAGY